MAENTRQYEQAKLTTHEARLAILQLSVMLNSGISITKCLESMLEAPQAEISKLAEGLFYGISRGLGLAESLSQATKSYSKVDLSLIKAGETSGRLALVLNKLGERLDKQQQLRTQLVSALTYPVGIVVVTSLMALFMANVMLPQLLSAAGQALESPSWSTRILLGLSEYSGTVTFLVVIAIASVPWFFSSVPLAIQIRSWLLFRSPGLGTIGRHSELARTSGQLAILLYAGITIHRALGLLESEDPDLEFAYAAALRNIANGLSLTESLAKTEKFERDFLALIEVGEESGRLERALDRQARYLEEQTHEKLQDGIKLIEPLAMVFLGGMVGLVILGCFLPIYQLVAQNL